MLVVKGRNERVNLAESPGILFSVSSMSSITGANIFSKTFFPSWCLQIRVKSFHHDILFIDVNVLCFFDKLTFQHYYCFWLTCKHYAERYWLVTPKSKRYSFFSLNTNVKILIFYSSLRNRLISLTTLIPVDGVQHHTSSG